MMKLNSRYEYYDELDLSKYVHQPADADGGVVSHRYILHSVLIHSGDVHAGHYYSYIKPKMSYDFYKFDDEEARRGPVSGPTPLCGPPTLTVVS